MAAPDQPRGSAPSKGAGASRSRSLRSMVRLRAPPPATIQIFGSFGSSGTMRAMASAVKAVKVAAPSAGDNFRSLSGAQKVGGSGLVGGVVKKRCSKGAPTHSNAPDALPPLPTPPTHAVL